MVYSRRCVSDLCIMSINIKKTDANSVTVCKTNQFYKKFLSGKKADAQLFYFMETFAVGNVCYNSIPLSVKSGNK